MAVGKGNISKLKEAFTEVGRDELRRRMYFDCDTLLEQAIRMLSIFELYGELPDDYHVDAGAVAVQASAIVEKLRQAQSYHREMLPPQVGR